MTDQQTIERAVLGKRVVAVSWAPVAGGEVFSLESLTLEGGTKLELWCGGYPYIVMADVKEGEHADA